MLRLVSGLGLLAALALAGCGRPVEVSSTRGPDGSDAWKRIECSHLDRRCYSTANVMCPNGYTFTVEGATRASGGVVELPPQESWRPTMYSRKPGALLVRCERLTAHREAR